MFDLKPVRVFGYVSAAGYAKYYDLVAKLLLDEDRNMFGCKVCITADKVVEDLDKYKILDHIETHHVKSTYECGECGMFLPTRRIINAHKLKKHGKDILNGSKNIAEICQVLHEQQSGTAILR